MYLCTQYDLGLFLQGVIVRDQIVCPINTLYIVKPVSEKPYVVEWVGGASGWHKNSIHSWLPDEFFMEVDNESK